MSASTTTTEKRTAAARGKSTTNIDTLLDFIFDRDPAALSQARTNELNSRADEQLAAVQQQLGYMRPGETVEQQAGRMAEITQRKKSIEDARPPAFSPANRRDYIVARTAHREAIIAARSADQLRFTDLRELERHSALGPEAFAEFRQLQTRRLRIGEALVLLQRMEAELSKLVPGAVQARHAAAREAVAAIRPLLTKPLDAGVLARLRPVLEDLQTEAEKLDQAIRGGTWAELEVLEAEFTQ